MSEVDDALEPENPIYVYQAEVSYLQREVLLVKAYNRDHAQDIIEKEYGTNKTFLIESLQLSTHDVTNSALNGTVN